VTDAGPIDADAYVVALGCYSTQILRPIGVSVPVYPVKGYSLTVPVIEPARSPVSTVMDETTRSRSRGLVNAFALVARRKSRATIWL